ncbi:MAG: DUF1002 domain-containing protein [Oscillospiraceae bacterium]|nr:DUF1002 domain-containing protein [Oscillospiraceae bacterium]
MRKTVSLLLLLALLLSLPLPASAESMPSRAVIGADLDEGQIEAVYALFGVRRGSVPELRVTNAEERESLTGYVDESVIGTRSISCVYMELLPEGGGLNVETHNITWYTGQMYANALLTAGITDARIIVAAPFEVSGTAALTGIYKAYEDMTGVVLDEQAKHAGTQELTVTGDLAEEIGSTDSASIVGELKSVLSRTQELSDEELRGVITEIAERYKVKLTETQIGQLVSLCRSIQSLNPEQIKQRVEEFQGTLEKVSEAKDKVVGFAETVKQLAQSVSEFFGKLSELLDKFK